MSGLLVTALIVLGILIGAVVISGLVLLVLKIGVVVNKAGEPPHIDHGVYTLDQGHEVQDPPELPR